MEKNQNFNSTPPEFPTGIPGFVADLQRYSPFVPRWFRQADQEKGEVDFSAGLMIRFTFPDPEGLLVTAVNDLQRFLNDAGIGNGDIPLVIRECKGMEQESFLIAVSEEGIVIEAGDTEGIRRGIYFLEDLFAAANGAFLKKQSICKKAWLKNRISRCFFGPIKRPPFNRDELTDDIDYYPDEYLNRLAHDGVNGLWLTVEFAEVSKTSFLPESAERETRLAKLRKSVEKCRRYGIKLWVFCIEPKTWTAVYPCPADHPELSGAAGAFCPASAASQQYLYECTNSLFSEVPHLGGLINISLGERSTSCLSRVSVLDSWKNPCAGKCDLSAAELLAKTLTPMYEGMRDVAPQAELISWIYIPFTGQIDNWVYTLPEKLDKNIILAFNFESGCVKEQLGKSRTGGDYWLSCVGPADRFGRIAAASEERCQLAAKLQVCCSHEVATVPYVPVPGLLYRKYEKMRELGVSHVIQCWYFGNYPGVMNQAAGKLAFEDFSRSEEDFLLELAAPYYQEHSSELLEIWRDFAEAYSNYPLDIQFQYYGPMHDGPVWPLHLKKVARILPRSWKPDHAPAGDAIGECLFNHTLSEAVILTERMAALWQRGMKKFSSLIQEYAGIRERELDISCAGALAIQFASGANILKFYSLRKQLLDGTADEGKLLDEMEKILKAETANSRQLAELCRQDSRLGYHSEAEVYKYFPAKLQWRAEFLEKTLETDFARCREMLKNGESCTTCLNPPQKLYLPGEKYQSDGINWNFSQTENDFVFDIAVENTVKNSLILLHFSDPLCAENTIRIRIAAADDIIDSSNIAQFSYREKDDCKFVSCKIPQMLYPEGRFCVGIVYCAWDEFNNWSVRSFPTGEWENVDRLNLGFFLPARMVLCQAE